MNLQDLGIILALIFVNMSKSFAFSEPQFPHLIIQATSQGNYEDNVRHECKNTS